MTAVRLFGRLHLQYYNINAHTKLALSLPPRATAAARPAAARKCAAVNANQSPAGMAMGNAAWHDVRKNAGGAPARGKLIMSNPDPNAA